MYRVYYLDRGAHITRHPEVIECESDQQAIERARELFDGQDLEIWDGARLVENISHVKPPPANGNVGS